MHCEQADGVLFFSNMQACPELLHPLQVVRRIARLLHIGVVDVRSMVNGEGFHMRSPFSPSMPNLPRSKGQLGWCMTVIWIMANPWRIFVFTNPLTMPV